MTEDEIIAIHNDEIIEEMMKDDKFKKLVPPCVRPGWTEPKYPREFNRSLTNSICQLYRFTCVICGRKFLHPKTHEDIDELDVHHIDYNTYNLDIKNLVPLCKKCHGKTNIGRDYWRSAILEIPVVKLTHIFLFENPIVFATDEEIANILNEISRKKKMKEEKERADRRSFIESIRKFINR